LELVSQLRAAAVVRQFLVAELNAALFGLGKGSPGALGDHLAFLLAPR
jgi:hypothetical protein